MSRTVDRQVDRDRLRRARSSGRRLRRGARRHAYGNWDRGAACDDVAACGLARGVLTVAGLIVGATHSRTPSSLAFSVAGGGGSNSIPMLENWTRPILGWARAIGKLSLD